jgi:hypothetical protein
MNRFLQLRPLAAATVALAAVTAMATEAQAAKKIASWLTASGSGCSFPSGAIYGAWGDAFDSGDNRLGDSPLSSGATAFRYDIPGTPSYTRAMLAQCSTSDLGSCFSVCQNLNHIVWGVEGTCPFTVGGCTWTAHVKGLN